MTATGFALFVLVAIVSIGLGLLLYALVRDEAADQQVVKRDEGERLARRDTDDEE